jgi:undecaprenyl-diphosphatase
VNSGGAVLLGVIQGLTEFLPVSSSAHLVFAQSLLPGFKQPGILFDVVLHMGTLSAVIFFLRKEIYALLIAMLPRSSYAASLDDKRLYDISTSRKTIGNIIIATLITGIIGLSFKNEVEKLFASPAVAAFMLVITGIMLFLTGTVKKADRGEEKITIVDSIIIGLAQGFAVLPGISRSGATISFGIFRGLKPETAARFSFLLSIPAVLGAVILEARHISQLTLPDIELYIAGFTAAAITGFLSLKLLFLLLKKWKLTFFAYYCWLAGFSFLLLTYFSH